MREDGLVKTTLDHLEWLVAASTQNPPRRIRESGVVERLRQVLGAGFTIETDDRGGGSISLLARRGSPRLLWNFHIDTVPTCPGWTRDPLKLHVEGDRATGLGACDIKGAAAAMLAAVAATKGDVALLFSSDEEAGQAVCIRSFLEKAVPFGGVIVAEPTGGRAVVAHRGIGTASGRFTGRAGHASRANAREDSAIHEAVLWAHAALAYAAGSEAAGPLDGGLSGVRFNLGRIEGGEKANVVAAESRVRFGVRPPPGLDPQGVLAELESLAPHPDRVAWESGFLGPPLPAATGHGAVTLLEAGRALAGELGLPLGPAVDFWTEAALFSGRGYPAAVFGPGDIAQAHTADEWVLLSDLAEVAKAYVRILTPT
jgi:acetylornithine deacetylase